MTRRISLEDFDGSVAQSQVPNQEEPDQAAALVDTDALKSTAFEEGYKSGWDDCHAEHVKSEQAVSSDLARSLRDMTATYREARSDVLSAVKPVIDTIVEQILPKIASAGLGAMVAQELMPHLQSATELEPELQCAPDMVPILQKLIDHRDDITLRIRPETSFSGAQVALRLGAEARNIDLSSAMDQIGQELASFTDRLIADLPTNQKG